MDESREHVGFSTTEETVFSNSLFYVFKVFEDLVFMLHAVPSYLIPFLI